MLRILLCLLLACLSSVYAQTEHQSVVITGTLDAGAANTKPNKQGLSSAIPATCSVGQTYFKTDATAGQNLFACTSTNTWTLQGGTGSSGLGDPGSNGIVKRTSLNTTTAATSGTDYVVPGGNVATATALAANGTNCSAGNYPLGVDASGNAENCTAAAVGLTGLTTVGSVPYVSGTNILSQDVTVGGQLFWDFTNHRLGIGNAAPTTKLDVTGGIRGTSLAGTATAFASLGTPSNGTLIYCSDCSKVTPCAAGGSGAVAQRLNGAWECGATTNEVNILSYGGDSSGVSANDTAFASAKAALPSTGGCIVFPRGTYLFTNGITLGNGTHTSLSTQNNFCIRGEGMQNTRLKRTSAAACTAAKSITSVTNASPAVVTITAHGYYDGQLVTISGATGLTSINGPHRLVTYIDANNFSLTDMSRTAINGNGAYTGSGTIVDRAPGACSVLTLQGPMLFSQVSGITLDGNNVVQNGLDIGHTDTAIIRDVSVENWLGKALYSTAVATTGSAPVLFGNCHIEVDNFRFYPAAFTSTAASGMWLDGLQSSSGTNFDTCSSTFKHIFGIYSGTANTYGIYIGYVDSVVMDMVFASNAAVDAAAFDFYFSPTANNGFPANIQIRHPVLFNNGFGGRAGSLSGATSGEPTVFVGPYANEGCSGGFGSKCDPGAVPNVYATDYMGRTTGARKINEPLVYANTTVSSNVASTTAETAFDRVFAVPANAISMQGTTFRVRLLGEYSTTGTPTLTIKVKFGTAVISSWTVTCASGASNAQWTAFTEFAAGTVGSGGSAYPGANAMLINGANPAVNTAGGLSFNTTIANNLTVTATWSAASASNTVHILGMNAELMYPGAVQ